MTLFVLGLTGCDIFTGVDLLKKGYTQEQLRHVVSSALRSTLPDDSTVLHAFREGSRDPTFWYLVSRSVAMSDLIIELQKKGYVRSSFSTATPPRAIPPALQPYINLVDFDDETSLMLTHRARPESSGVWIIFNKHKKGFMACSYSS